MSSHGQSTVLNLQRFVPGGAVEASHGPGSSPTASMVRTEAERALNDAAFIDNMSTE